MKKLILFLATFLLMASPAHSGTFINGVETVDYAVSAGTAATATALAANPTDCGANAVATAIAANGDLTCSYSIGTNIQAYNADLNTLAGGGSANCLWGEKSDSSGIECKSTINVQLDDSAAQFKSATASKGTLKFVQSSIDNGILATVTPVCTGNCNIKTDSYGAGDYYIVDKTSTQTLTNKTLTSPSITTPAITSAEVDGHTDQTALTAAQVSNTVITNYDQGAGDVFLLLPAAAAGYSFVATVATAQAKHFGVEAAANDKIYLIAADGTIAAGDDNAGVVMTAAQVGQQFACWTFKTGATAYDWACKAIAIGTSTFAAHAHSTP